MSFDTKPINFVPKGWGYEEWFANSPLYCGKLLFVKRRRKCSWHHHERKDETFYVVDGELILRYVSAESMGAFIRNGWDEYEVLTSPSCFAEIRLRPGDKFHIPVGMYHQFEGAQDTKVIEVSTQHFDEDSKRVIRGD